VFFVTTLVFVLRGDAMVGLGGVVDVLVSAGEDIFTALLLVGAATAPGDAILCSHQWIHASSES
jgi:hypothetical protein